MRKNEAGLVSIVIVTTIAIILSLMTIGFTRIMDRELREATDLELATQAHYAAEAGINDAKLYLAGGGAPANGADCLDISSNPFVESISGSYSGNTSDNNVKYTCVLVDPDPYNLVYELQPGDSVVFKITPATPSDTISTMFFSWHNNDVSTTGIPASLPPLTTAPTDYALPQESAVDPNATGLLRATIYRIPSSTVNDATLASNSRTYFFYPNLGPAGLGQTVAWSDNGEFVDGNCNIANLTAPPLPYPQAGGRFCNSAVDVLAASEFYVRLTAVYHTLSVSVQADTSSGSSVRLAGAQAVIDVTGQGNDVLKRIQARAPLRPSYDIPEYAIHSMQTLCKRLRIPQTGSSSFGPAEPGDDPSAYTNDPVCLPPP